MTYNEGYFHPLVDWEAQDPAPLFKDPAVSLEFATTLAHELYHGVQRAHGASASSGSSIDWYQEGMPEAVAIGH